MNPQSRSPRTRVSHGADLPRRPLRRVALTAFAATSLALAACDSAGDAVDAEPSSSTTSTSSSAPSSRTPSPTSTTASSTSSTSTAPSPTESSAPAAFANCRQAFDAGAAPLYAGNPGYDPALDPDGDGVACPIGEETDAAGAVAPAGIMGDPRPAPAPAPSPEPAPAPAPAPVTGGGGDVYYPNCKAARAAGAAPIRAGEPGYRAALDRDRDGIACE